MTELSGDTCEQCGKAIAEGEVNWRLSSTTKLVNQDGTDKLGNPLDVDVRPFCPECAAERDKSN